MMLLEVLGVFKPPVYYFNDFWYFFAKSSARFIIYLLLNIKKKKKISRFLNLLTSTIFVSITLEWLWWLKSESIADFFIFFKNSYPMMCIVVICIFRNGITNRVTWLKFKFSLGWWWWWCKFANCGK